MKIKKKAFINGLVILILGIAIGYTAAQCKWGRCWGAHSHEGGKEAYLLRKFTDRLDLDEEQQSKVKLILSAQNEKLQLLRGEISPKFREIRVGTHSEVSALLKEDQLAKFEKLKQEMEEYRKKKWGRKR